MQIYFTHYAEKKFEILNKHEFSCEKDRIKDAVQNPDKVDKKGRYLSAKKEGLKVVYQKEEDALKIITFYPVSSE